MRLQRIPETPRGSIASMRKEFEFGSRHLRQSLHFGSRSWRRLITVDNEHRQVCLPGQLKKGRAACNTVQCAADEANGGMPGAGDAGYCQLCAQSVTAKPIGILVDVLPRHPGDDEPAHI